MTDYLPQPGDIGLVPGGGSFMQLVRLITRSKYGHAFIYAGKGTIVEAEPGVWWPRIRFHVGGIRHVPLTYHDVYWCRNLSRDLTALQREGIVAWAMYRLGTPYSFIDDAEVGFVDLFGWAPKWMRNRLVSEKTMMCSQMCDADYEANGKHIFADGRIPGGVAPGDLWRADQEAA